MKIYTMNKTMNKTIEVARIAAKGDTIKYELRDHTDMGLLRKPAVEAWVKFHNADSFGFSTEGLPESILLIPITLYLYPITYFYGVELVVPSMDKELHEALPSIYEAYSKIYGPFKEEWRGKVTAGTVVENRLPESRFDKVVFFSGGVDAVHTSINNPGKRSVLVSVPSIEAMAKAKKENPGEDFLKAKTVLIREFSSLIESGWLVVVNNFMRDVFDDERILRDLNEKFKLDSVAFRADGWLGIRYIGNMCSAAPFAYAMGIRFLIMGSTYEPIENKDGTNKDGAAPEFSDSMRFAGISFAEQEGIRTRRSQKVRNIIAHFNREDKKTKLWVCFDDGTSQCGECNKCIRTQLNILCAGESPRDWGFERFSEKRFSRLVRAYAYGDNVRWLWDIIDSIDSDRAYPYCDDLLHWLKRIGYKEYRKRVMIVRNVKRLFKIHRYPHFVKVLFMRIFR